MSTSHYDASGLNAQHSLPPDMALEHQHLRTTQMEALFIRSVKYEKKEEK